MDQSWRDEAACIGLDSEEGNIFFASEKQDVERKTALAICKGCPVRLTCLREAIDNDDDYIRGGTTYSQRKIMSLFMIALTPIPSSSSGPSGNGQSLSVHTVQVEIHTYHNETPEQHPFAPIPPFELNQSVLGVSGIRPLSEVLRSQAEPESLPLPLPSFDFSNCLVASACA